MCQQALGRAQQRNCLLKLQVSIVEVGIILRARVAIFGGTIVLSAHHKLFACGP